MRNAVASAFRSAAHAFAAFTVVWFCAATVERDLVATHLPNALSAVPYFAANPAASAASVLQAEAAETWAELCAFACCETHVPKVLYVAVKVGAVIDFCSAVQVCDGFGVACRSAAVELCVFEETQLPKAFLPCLPLP